MLGWHVIDLMSVCWACLQRLAWGLAEGSSFDQAAAREKTIVAFAAANINSQPHTWFALVAARALREAVADMHVRVCVCVCVLGRDCG